MRDFCLIGLLFAISVGVCRAADEPAASKAIGIAEAVRMVPQDLQTPGRYALVIGVSDYQDSRVPDLPACVNDAQMLHQVLLDPMHGMFSPENVTVLLNEKVTGKEVVDALDKISSKAGKDDLVVLFFSGHGAVDEKGRSYWVMHDTDITRLRATALPESDITELTQEIKSNRLVMLIDSCYAASTAQVGGSKSLLDINQLYPKFTGQGRVAITASKGDQLSVVIKDKQHPGYGFSAFSWNIISGLKGQGDTDGDGVVTVTELWDYVKDRTESTARQQGGNQQPQLKGQIGSKFLLTVDGQKLIENSKLVQQSMAALKKLFMEDKITSTHYKEAEQLIKTDPAKLSETDQQKRQVYLDLAEGRLTSRYLQTALDAIETPAQRQSRLDREAAELAARQRQQKISELLQTAKAKDNKTQGKEALRALDELLLLESSHFEALQLKKKISGYYVQPFEVRENTLGMTLVYLPPGSFMMGDTLSPEEVHRKWPGGQLEWYQWSHPRRRVELTKGFYMGATEVTRGQFAQFVRETNYQTDAEKQGNAWAFKDGSFKEVPGVYWKNPLFDQNDSHPVVCVSHNDVIAFCEWLSKKENKTYTLPTEAQWKYACRGGKDATTWYWGNDESGAQGKANVAGEGEEQDWTYKFKGVRDGYTYTAPVGSFEANPYGLYDTIGNVWEWCQDWFQDSYNGLPSVDPQGPSSGQARVLRGGSWGDYPHYCRAAYRFRLTPGYRSTNLGFRVVCLDFQ